MKKLIALALVVVSAVTSCNKFDDSEIWDKLNDHESRIAYLEDLCKKMNTDIVNLQTLVTALDAGDYIVNASPLVTGDGYTFIFKSGKSVVIYNGKDGVNGSNGINGQDGKDGVTPVISVKQDVDGVYYWTVNGEWLIVDGAKVRASAMDGTNGTNGVNGVTPKFKIEDDYWYISYDDGVSWEKLGKATGDNGLNGENGDAFFSGVAIGDGYVVFTLNDTFNTQIKLPFVTDTQVSVIVETAGTLRGMLTIEQQRNVTSLKIHGPINEDDLKFVNVYLRSLETLDLSNAVMNTGVSVNPFQSVLPNTTLRTLIVGELFAEKSWQPKNIDIAYCMALEEVIFTANHTCLDESSLERDGWPQRKGVMGAPNLSLVKVHEGVTELNLIVESGVYSLYCVCPTVDLPSSLEKVQYLMFGIFHASDIICRAVTPPTPCSYSNYGSGYELREIESFYDGYNQLDDMTLYVPSESLELYKNHTAWQAFGNILPIEQ